MIELELELELEILPPANWLHTIESYAIYSRMTEPTTLQKTLVHAAHRVCPYSNATRGNIAVDVKVADG